MYGKQNRALQVTTMSCFKLFNFNQPCPFFASLPSWFVKNSRTAFSAALRKQFINMQVPQASTRKLHPLRTNRLSFHGILPWASFRQQWPNLRKLKIRKLLDKDLMKFYGRYVDDTLVLTKPENVNKILSEFNSFHEKVRFTVENFDNNNNNNNVHLLDLRLTLDWCLPKRHQHRSICRLW